jgi:hypothetical protein
MLKQYVVHSALRFVTVKKKKAETPRSSGSEGHCIGGIKQYITRIYLHINRDNEIRYEALKILKRRV